MIARLRTRLTYANVMATIAVFIALGGGAYAASKLPKNSVGGKQIKKNAVTSKKVKNHTLKFEDTKAGQFAAPGDLTKYLLASGTAANSKALGGVGPGGFVKGGGRRLEGTASNGGIVGVPGGVVFIVCNSSSYDVGATSNIDSTRTLDIFETFLHNGPTIVNHYQSPPSTGGLTETGPTQFNFDISSADFRAEVTVFADQDPSTHACTARASGYINP